MGDLAHDRRAVCRRHGAGFRDTPPESIIGVADNVRAGAYPLNGLRHAVGSTSGWFIWAGSNVASEPYFFRPLHAHHLLGRCPEVMPMLGLAEGWRFLIAPGHEDVWYDASLLDDKV